MSILIAGVGNIFLSDDGFGCAVADRLNGEPLPDGVRVADFGIRAVHLAYELMDGYDGLILVDAVARGEAPGTVYVIEPDLDAVPEVGSPALDAHSMSPDTVFALLKGLGTEVGKIYVVGCEPAELGEGMELSPAVAAAVESAATVARDLALKLLAQKPPAKQLLVPDLPAEKPSVGKPLADKLSAGKPLADKLPAEKLPADKLLADKLLADKLKEPAGLTESGRG